MTTALALIEALTEARERVRREPTTRKRLARLQRWQVQRLRRTYADFERDPRYAEALEFFVSDLYGPHEYSRRDRDLRKVLSSWERLLPPRASRAVVAALELEALSHDLDLEMVSALQDTQLDGVTYANAYRRVGRRPDRVRQIELIQFAGAALDDLVRMPVIGAALRMARTPARLAGVTYLHQFLERGYRAFARMRDARPLLQAIQQRETRLMNALFAGESAPDVETR
ncbi:MAG TPA: hypothetical protein VK025_08005 [Steroidobacter sp.]|jgi:hypothetical protein|nr:hypothetical protein [Steroidobacteraceae bacterium]HLS81331.1 hypothetical protein [Steroidobacter sp.]